MKTGIFGGTFDPPHIGHMAAASKAVKELGLDLLYVIPTGQPPHKSIPQNAPSSDMRFDMTCLAAEEVESAVISGIELYREGRSYTVHTLEELSAKRPEDELYLFMGTDMFLSIEKWYMYETVMQKVTFAVFSREGGEYEKLCDFSKYLKERYGAKSVVIKNDVFPVSSTEIREKLQYRGGREYLNPSVYAYIIKNRLFDAKPDFLWLREKTYARLNTRRIPHVKGCEEEAVKLAAHWGANVDAAREAAIMHDITKNLSLADQLILCEKYGIITDNLEKKDAKLLHSKTGAEVAKREFAADEDVYNAICWHTTGKENMSLLEKIIYMADYIEPTRDFPGVDKLRELAYLDLDKAMVLGFEMSLEDMKDRNIVPHGATVRALNWLKANVGA